MCGGVYVGFSFQGCVTKPHRTLYNVRQQKAQHLVPRTFSRRKSGRKSWKMWTETEMGARGRGLIPKSLGRTSSGSSSITLRCWSLARWLRRKQSTSESGRRWGWFLVSLLYSVKYLQNAFAKFIIVMDACMQ